MKVVQRKCALSKGISHLLLTTSSLSLMKMLACFIFSFVESVRWPVLEDFMVTFSWEHLDMTDVVFTMDKKVKQMTSS